MSSLHSRVVVRAPEAVRVLEADRGLATGLSGREAALAGRQAVAAVLAVEPGPWTPPERSDPGDIGLLVLEGLLERSTDLAGIGCTELLGTGDLLHPWEEDEGEPSLPFEVRWRVLEPTQLAVLDARFADAVSGWPSITGRLVGRAARLTQSLAAHFTITCFVGLELRLYVLFWHLADRFGTVEREGVVVPLRLTHETLARLVRARRPSVTAALGKLIEQGLLERRADECWLLRGDPPRKFDRLREAGGEADVRG